mmetsp:Transcript_33466/g.54478  ORF Transcript_33466/g.54478 Transcript_33466/m.54478 type:complete len:287 (-) Transcript_33466:895-1755(-)
MCLRQLRNNRVTIILGQFFARFMLRIQEVSQRTYISRNNRFSSRIRLHRRQNHRNSATFHQWSTRRRMNRQFTQRHGSIVEEDCIGFVRLNRAQQWHCSILGKRLRIFFHTRNVDNHLDELVHHVNIGPIVVVLGHFDHHLTETNLGHMTRRLQRDNHLTNRLTTERQNLLVALVLLHNLRHHFTAAIHGQLGRHIRIGGQHFEQFECRGQNRLLKHQLVHNLKHANVTLLIQKRHRIRLFIHQVTHTTQTRTLNLHLVGIRLRHANNQIENAQVYHTRRSSFMRR